MGDDGDWREWLCRNGPAMWLYARQWAPSRIDAEDLVQEAFVRFWQGRQRVQDPKAYLFACIRTCGIDGARARASRKRHEERSGHEQLQEVWFSLPAEAEESQAVLQSALRRLPPEQRETVVLKVWGELTFEQIGRAMDTSPHTASSRYRYALQNLRRELERDACHG